MSAGIIRRLIWSAVLPPVIVVALLAALLVWQIEQLKGVDHMVDHTDQVIAETNYLQKLLLDEETGLRGFLLSQSDDFLQPFDSAEKQLAPALASLRALVSDNPEQLARLTELEARHATWVAGARQNIDSVHAGTDLPVKQSAALVANLRARKALMDQMRSVVDRSLAHERSLLSERKLRAEQRSHRTIWGAGVVIVAMALLIALFVYRGLMRVQKSYATALEGEQQARRAADALAAEVIEQSRMVETKYRETADARERAERRLAELEGKPET